MRSDDRGEGWRLGRTFSQALLRTEKPNGVQVESWETAPDRQIPFRETPTLTLRLRFDLCLRILRRDISRRVERGANAAICQEQYVFAAASSTIPWPSSLPTRRPPVMSCLPCSSRTGHVTRRIIRRVYPYVRHHQRQGRAALHPW